MLFFLPVCSYFNIKRHLDIEEILVLFKVPGHFTFSGSEFIVKLIDCVL